VTDFAQEGGKRARSPPGGCWPPSWAPTGADLLARAESGAYHGRYELLRDVALNLLWVDRYAITMYARRPTRWRDVARQRDDVFLPALTPWLEGERKVSAIEACYASLPATWDAEAEDRIFRILFDVFRHRPGSTRWRCSRRAQR